MTAAIAVPADAVSEVLAAAYGQQDDKSRTRRQRIRRLTPEQAVFVLILVAADVATAVDDALDAEERTR